MKFGLKPNTIQQIHSVFIQYPQVETAMLYGSRVKGNYKTGSDIDLTLTGHDLELALLYKIATAIDDLLLPYTFDLSIYKHISNPDLLAHIERVGRIFYQARAINTNSNVNHYELDNSLSDY